jgi:hypothetical protein
MPRALGERFDDDDDDNDLTGVDDDDDDVDGREGDLEEEGVVSDEDLSSLSCCCICSVGVGWWVRW